LALKEGEAYEMFVNIGMRKAVLSISGNVYKQQEMEIDKLIYDA
jgi:hypothetical protein